MLWLALQLPTLPLDALHLSLTPTPPEAWVVVETQGRQEWIVAANPTARAAGIRPGMRSAAAQVLVSQLRIAQRQPQQELALLGTLAGWAMQFSPTVCLDPPLGLLLEIEGCLQYFKGWQSLQDRILAGMQALDITIRPGLAHTPLAASWFAQAGVAPVLQDVASYRQALAQLMVHRLPLTSAVHRQLQALGLRTLGDLRRLPRDGLATRFGTALLDQLDQAWGDRPDPRTAYEPPARFERTVALNWATDQIDALGFVAKRLYGELAAFLAGRGLGVQAVVLHFQHGSGSRSELAVAFGQPTRSADAMLAITRERLARHVLKAAVEGVTLCADQLHRLDGEALGLFGQATATADFALLRARLAARLGPQAIRSLVCVADHRPEHAWAMASADTPSAQLQLAARPGWLLAEPIRLTLRDERPWYGEPLSLDGRGERIESGWWDGKGIARDYFQAQGPSGRRYWLYRQRGEADWYLHGLFG